MNLNNVKNISKVLMVVGGGLFTCGFGINLSISYVEHRRMKDEQYKDMLEQEKLAKIRADELNEEKINAAIDKDRVLAEKVRNMNADEFIKYKAKEDARVNSEVLARADKIRNEATAKIEKMRYNCDDEITKIRKECIDKIEAANKMRDEAIDKYETIDKLFYNKKEILKAQEYLKNMAEKEDKNKTSKEELLKSLKEIL